MIVCFIVSICFGWNLFPNFFRFLHFDGNAKVIEIGDAKSFNYYGEYYNVSQISLKSDLAPNGCICDSDLFTET